MRYIVVAVKDEHAEMVDPIRDELEEWVKEFFPEEAEVAVRATVFVRPSASGIARDMEEPCA